MVKSISIKNYLGQELTITLNEDTPSHGLLVKKIDGFGPSKSNIATLDYSFLPGSLYQYSRSENRNIVIDFYFTDVYEGMTIEKARLNCYKYFPIGQELELKISTDQGSYTISGYVEKNEPNVFSNRESAQVSIICPDPFFNGSLETYDEKTISGQSNFGSSNIGREGEWDSDDQYPAIKIKFPRGIYCYDDLYELYGDSIYFAIQMISYPKQGSTRSITARIGFSFFRLCGISDSTNLNATSYLKLENVNGAVKLTAVLYDGVSAYNTYDVTNAILDITQDQEFKIQRGDMYNSFVAYYAGPTSGVSIMDMQIEVATYEMVDLSVLDWGYSDRIELSSKTDIVCGCVIKIDMLDDVVLQSNREYILELENITEGGSTVNAPGWYRITIDIKKVLEIVDNTSSIEGYKLLTGDELIVSTKTGKKFIHYKRNDVEYNVIDAAGTSAINWIKIHNGSNRFYCTGVSAFNQMNVSTKYIEYEELHGGI